jgi:hypothetical protein
LVSGKSTEANPLDEATTLYGPPAVKLAVHVTDTVPLALVVPEVAESAQLAPDAGAANVTKTPLTGTPALVTVATNGLANAVPTVALCPPPLVAARIDPPPTTLVSGKKTEANPADETATLYAPAVEFAVKIREVAWPFAPVTSGSIVDAGVVAKVALAPEAGAVKVTVTPLTGLL